MPNIQYFLGGNTPAGFYSLYHQLSDPTRTRALYIVKGGPGSGKSTLMRRVERHAQAAGGHSAHPGGGRWLRRAESRRADLCRWLLRRGGAVRGGDRLS